MRSASQARCGDGEGPIRSSGMVAEAVVAAVRVARAFAVVLALALGLVAPMSPAHAAGPAAPGDEAKSDDAARPARSPRPSPRAGSARFADPPADDADGKRAADAAATPAPAASDGARLAERPADTALLDQAAEALADFDGERAVGLLERARRGGPWSWADHARLYEQLGVAYAYLEKPEPSSAAFEMLLAIDPARAISYTLSPKVTFLFEKVRKAAHDKPAPAIHVSWRPDLKVEQEVPIEIEIVEDPRQFLVRGVLGWRLKGSPRYEQRRFALPAKGVRHVEILPPTPSSKREALEIYVAGLDGDGNEVHLWSSPARPREVALDYDAPTPWFGRWWVWTIAGAAVAAGATAAAVAVASEPPATVGGTFSVGP